MAIKGNSGEMEMMTFVHVFESATAQDSSSVLAILGDVFSQLKAIMHNCRPFIFETTMLDVITAHRP